MGYSIIDLLDKSIKVAIHRKKIYEDIGKEKYDIPSIGIMSKVLAREMDKTINYYEALKNEIKQVEFDEIDFYIYDKMSFLIDEYNKKTCVTEISNIKEYLKFSLDSEKDEKSLLMDVQGRFVKNEIDLKTKTYEILSNMINNKAVNIAVLQKILK